jgi:hypothetical protein
LLVGADTVDADMGEAVSSVSYKGSTGL